jgi:glycosyltransferase involved in cell wall biosynthesis
MSRNILFLIPYPLNEAPSQRFRFEQYFALLESRGFQCVTQSFLNSQNWAIFFKPGNRFLKAALLLSGFFRRISVLFKARQFSYVFIHREATPVGPPFIEWWISKILRRRIIYDFDDAIWLTDKTDESALVNWLRCRGKVAAICKWSYRVSCGNKYLCDYARQYNNRVVLNPTTIASIYEAERKDESGIVTIGWTGSHSTLKYLEAIQGILRLLLDENPRLKLCVIADRKPDLDVPFEFVRWRRETEIEDLLRFDIGIMPLPDDVWTRGKCGFKALQYMSIGIPALASPVGVNTTIIESGVTGFLCSSDSDWVNSIKLLADDPSARHRMGAAGKEKVRTSYSYGSNASNFLSLFDAS